MPLWAGLDEVVRGEIEGLGIVKGGGGLKVEVIMRGDEEGCHVTCRGADVK